MVHGFLDVIVHIDSTKGVEENASNIVTGSAREGFIGLMYGAGFEFAAMCVGNTSLPALSKLFIMVVQQLERQAGTFLVMRLQRRLLLVM